jgi:hypothetical protein
MPFAYLIYEIDEIDTLTKKMMMMPTTEYGYFSKVGEIEQRAVRVDKLKGEALVDERVHVLSLGSIAFPFGQFLGHFVVYLQK